MARHSGCCHHSALPVVKVLPWGLCATGWHGLSKVDHTVNCIVISILTIIVSLDGELSMHKAQFQVLYRTLVSALIWKAEAQLSPDLLMRCWNLQRLSNKTKGTTIFICFVPRPTLLPLPTPLPTVTETPPGVSRGPSSWLRVSSTPRALGFPEIWS